MIVRVRMNTLWFIRGRNFISRYVDSKSESRQDGPRINESISAAKVRLVDNEGNMVGVVSRLEALKKAEQAGFDLVEISPQADPPVCKMLNYGKYKYEQQKKKHEAKKNQKVMQVKEVQLRPMIADNDLNLKSRDVKRFLEQGDKVKVVLRFRGREMSNQERGMVLLERIRSECEALAKVELAPRLEGRQMVLVLAPLTQKS